MTQQTAPSQCVCTVVATGEAQARVRLEKQTRPYCTEAVRELVTGIAKATGARIPIDGTRVFERVLEPPRPAPTTISFKLANRESNLGKDGFRISVKPREINIEGTGKNSFDNAVYTFLERHCGFRWLWPGSDGEVFKQLRELSIPVGQTSEQPDYQWRHLLYSDMPEEPDSKWGIQEFHMQSSAACHELFTEWLRRNRMGGLRVMIGHTWGRFVNPDQYGREHPEYFAEIKGSRQASIDNFTGKHGGQLCTSNPEVVELLTRRVREHFDQNPGLDVISISPNDGSGFCECDACLAIDLKYGNPPPQARTDNKNRVESTFRDDADDTVSPQRITGPITDRIFEFANQIAAGIAESHPDKKLLLLVYSLYRDPPRKLRLADNIIAQFCVSCHQHWEPALRQADYAAIAELANKTGETGIYEYLDQGAWPGPPRIFPSLIADSVRFFQQQGVRHYSTQAATGFAASGLNLWMLSRLLWNTRLKVDDLLDDYCETAFGRAAPAMRIYFKLWEERWRDCKGVARLGGSLPGSAASEGLQLAPFEQIIKLYPVSFIAQLKAEIVKAGKLVRPNSPERGRIDFCARALHGTMTMLEAARFSYGLRDRGWPLRHDQVTAEAVAGLGPPEQVRKLARQGLGLWSKWEAELETMRDDFIFSFFWARYCYDSRKALHPHYAFQRVLEILA